MQQHKIEREQGWSVVRLCSGHFPPPPHSSQALSHTVFIIRDSGEKNVFFLWIKQIWTQDIQKLTTDEQIHLPGLLHLLPLWPPS